MAPASEPSGNGEGSLLHAQIFFFAQTPPNRNSRKSLPSFGHVPASSTVMRVAQVGRKEDLRVAAQDDSAAWATSRSSGELVRAQIPRALQTL